MMNDREIGLQRLSSQRIARETFEHPEDAVRWMTAIQAQDYMQAVWAIGVRTSGGTQAAVEQAIEDGKIVRTWPMRGTLHFIPAEDVRWMLMLSASRMIAADQHRMKQLELNVDIMARCTDLFREALSGGKRLSRPDMMALLEGAGISTHGQRGYHILWYIAQSGVICLGPMQDKQQTFVLLDEWVPESRDLTREEALAELARRYVTSHGPVTVYDLAWWAGITITDARLGLEGAGHTLVSVTSASQEYWQAAGAEPLAANTPGSTLLPGFDEYLLGYKDRSAVLATEHAQKVVPGNNGIFRAMIVIDGQVAGTWTRRLKKNSVDVTLYPFGSLNGVEDQVTDAARDYADFIGLPLSVAVANGAD